MILILNDDKTSCTVTKQKRWIISLLIVIAIIAALLIISICGLIKYKKQMLKYKASSGWYYENMVEAANIYGTKIKPIKKQSHERGFTK